MNRHVRPLLLGRDVTDPVTGLRVIKVAPGAPAPAPSVPTPPPPAPSAAPAGLTLGEVWLAVRRRMLGVAAATLVGGALGALAAGGIEDRYAATAQLVLDPELIAVAAPDRAAVNPLPEQSEIATIAQAIASPLVADRVIERLDAPALGRLAAEAGAAEGPDEHDAPVLDHLLRRLEVGTDGRSLLVAVTFRSEDPALARDVANGFAEAYLDLRREARREALGEVLGGIRTEVEALRRDLVAAEQTAAELREERRALGLRMDALVGEPRAEATERNAELYAGEREAVRKAEAMGSVFEQLLVGQREIEARFGIPDLAVRPFAAARLPTEPDGPDIRPVVLALGLGAGLFVGAALAVLRRRGADA